MEFHDITKASGRTKLYVQARNEWRETERRTSRLFWWSASRKNAGTTVVLPIMSTAIDCVQRLPGEVLCDPSYPTRDNSELRKGSDELRKRFGRNSRAVSAVFSYREVIEE